MPPEPPVGVEVPAPPPHPRCAYNTDPACSCAAVIVAVICAAPPPTPPDVDAAVAAEPPPPPPTRVTCVETMPGGTVRFRSLYQPPEHGPVVPLKVFV
jgi:hypothetical protein